VSLIAAAFARRSRLVPALAALALLAAAGPAAAAAAGDAPSAEDTVRALERRYAAISSLSASFVQTFRSASMGQQVVERGKLYVKRPGLMRWDYRSPDKKVFLVNADGTTVSYVPADLSATRSRMPADAPHLKLLLGQSDLLAGFVASEVELKAPMFPGSRQIKLVPRTPEPTVETVYIEIDRRLGSVLRVLVVDSMLNESDLVLEKVNEDAKLAPDTFDLRLPPGIEMRDTVASSGGG
jgi:outer membrane lipoprotein-sorting protein